MNKKEKLAFAVVAALSMSGGGFAVAQSVNNVSSNQVVYSCVNNSTGVLSLISTKSVNCPKGTTSMPLNKQGPKGDAGLQGPKGDAGFSYGEALASVNDQNSNVKTFFTGEVPSGDRFGTCINSTLWMSFINNTRAAGCQMNLVGVKKISILSVKAVNENLTAGQIMYLLPSQCLGGSFEWMTDSYLRDKAVGFLVSGGAPFSISVEAESACLVTRYFTQSGQNTAFQVVYSTN